MLRTATETSALIEHYADKFKSLRYDLGSSYMDKAPTAESILADLERFRELVIAFVASIEAGGND
jgi:hypothetical protein